MSKDRHTFDIETRRFIEHRWETTVGEKVKKNVIEGIKEGVDIRFILDKYVLRHDENIEPYGYPIYPKSELSNNEFWVLTNDDLRGISIYHEDFSSSPSLEKKDIEYAYFNGCNFNEVDFSLSGLSFCTFKNCVMQEAIFYEVNGHKVNFLDCKLQKTKFLFSKFSDCDFSGADLSEVYFEDSLLVDIHVNYKTKIDNKLNGKWNENEIASSEKPDILRAFRIAYEKTELWEYMDIFLYAEKRAQRRYIFWPDLKEQKSISNFKTWSISLLSGTLSGYATKPSQVILTGFVIACIYSILYFSLGSPTPNISNTSSFLESIYFSFTTFATLGYGDLSYTNCRPFMRILSTTEAWLGAINISLFVVVLARKLFR